MFVSSYLQGLEHEAWVEARKAEHETLYPKEIDGEAVLDEDGTTVLYYEQIPNPDYVEFDTWMAETEQVQVGTKDILDEDGITVVGTEPIYEDRLIRSYAEVPVDVEAWKSTAPEYKAYLDAIKDDTLDRLTVTTASGKVFYADPTSRDDMALAVHIGERRGQTETRWKLAEPIEGVDPVEGTDRVYVVLVSELDEAVTLALESKGKIVGAL
ncbi:MAG: hypothetical protein ABXS91_10530 [Sulfurimonas sp.]